METLHAQGSSDSSSTSTEGYGETNPMKTDLNTLLSKLSSADDSATESTSTDGSVSDLQSKFSDLLSSLGASDSGVSLSDFLQSFSSKVPDGSNSHIGNVVNTTA